MSFRILGLDPEPFRPLFDLDEAALAARDMALVVADRPHAAPCRVSLADAEPGETLLLLSFEHQPAASPYRASGPIFVRREATPAAPQPGEIPEALRRRKLSARAYDDAGTMVDAELVDGTEAGPVLERMLARAEVDAVHLHYALRGCYAARAVRA